MVAGLDDYEVVAVHQIDQSMLFVDPPRPAACEHVAEGFRLSNPRERVSERILEEAVEPFQQLAVGRLPVLVVLPPVRGEDQPQASSSRTLRCPA